MCLQTKINDLKSKYIQEHFEKLYNDLNSALNSNEQTFFYSQSDESIIKECEEKALNDLTNKEKFDYYYENN